jgi:hypothetical protein
MHPVTGYFGELVGKTNDQDQATGDAEKQDGTGHGTGSARFRQTNQRLKKRRRWRITYI